MSEANQTKQGHNHPAEEYLKNATGVVISEMIRWTDYQNRIAVANKAGKLAVILNPVKHEHRYLFCDWRHYACNQALIYTGLQNREKDLGGTYHCFKCVNCKGLVEHNKIQMAQQRNVVVGKDTEVVFDDEFLGRDNKTTYCKYLEIPSEPVWRYVDVKSGHSLHSTLVELNEADRFAYYTRGFSNHPDLQIKK